MKTLPLHQCLNCQALKKITAQGRCNACYLRGKSNGTLIVRNKPKELSERNYSTNKEYILTGAKGEKWLVDGVDFNRCSKFLWCDKEGYAMARIAGKNQVLHRFILKAARGNIVDHIDGNLANNKRNNLRFVNIKDNNLNQNIGRDRYVYFCKKYKSWFSSKLNHFHSNTLRTKWEARLFSKIYRLRHPEIYPREIHLLNRINLLP